MPLFQYQPGFHWHKELAQPHPIRLHGPWLASIDGGSEFKFKLPESFPDWPASESGNSSDIVLKRKFNLPTSLSPEQKVGLAIKFGFSEQAGNDCPWDLQIVVAVNGHETLVSWHDEVEISVKDFLQPHNLLTIVFKTESTDSVSSAVRVKQVALLIYDDAEVGGENVH